MITEFFIKLGIEATLVNWLPFFQDLLFFPAFFRHHSIFKDWRCKFPRFQSKFWIVDCGWFELHFFFDWNSKKFCLSIAFEFQSARKKKNIIKNQATLVHYYCFLLWIKWKIFVVKIFYVIIFSIIIV